MDLSQFVCLANTHLLRENLRVVYALLLKLCLRAMSPRWSYIQQQLKL
jgi:hypothetical protein